jgi:hypothetical protein
MQVRKAIFDVGLVLAQERADVGVVDGDGALGRR